MNAPAGPSSPKPPGPFAPTGETGPFATTVHYASANSSTQASATESRPPSDDLQDPRLRWDVRLEEMKTLARSGQQRFIKGAVKGLKELRRRVPAAAEIVAELAFALIELAEVTGDEQHYCRAVKELADFEERQIGFYSHDTELLCRAGRIWKDAGDRALLAATSPREDGGPAAAISPAQPQPFQLTPLEWYSISASYYRCAYEASGDYYPGINLATLEFLIAAIQNRRLPSSWFQPATPYSRSWPARSSNRWQRTTTAG